MMTWCTPRLLSMATVLSLGLAASGSEAAEGQANNEGDAPGYTMIGVPTCKDWTGAVAEEFAEQKEQERKRAEDPTGLHLRGLSWVTTMANLRWVLGYLSAINTVAGYGVGRKDVLERVDALIVRDWLDSYCKQNPEAWTNEAATDLYLKLAE